MSIRNNKSNYIDTMLTQNFILKRKVGEENLQKFLSDESPQKKKKTAENPN